MKRILYIVAIVAVIALLVWVKIAYFSPATTGGAAGGASAKPPASSVAGLIVKPERADDLIFSAGTVVPNESVVLVTETSGRITQLYFKEGSFVRQGDLLVKINDAEPTAELARLKLQLKLATEREERTQKLLAIGGISQEEYDVALTQKLSLQAEIDMVNVTLSKTELRAPFSGTIGLRKASVGSYATPAMEIATLSQTDPVKIDFSVPEKYAGKIHTGDTVNFTVPGNDTHWQAAVSAIEPQIDLATRTLKIRALCRNPEGRIYPGAFARIELNAGTNNNSLQIPTQALIKEFKGQKVFLCKNGKATPVAVEIGKRTEATVEITSGISAGDTLITTGIMSLKPGTDVKVKLAQ